jgi:hypothetical protein
MVELPTVPMAAQDGARDTMPAREPMHAVEQRMDRMEAVALARRTTLTPERMAPHARDPMRIRSGEVLLSRGGIRPRLDSTTVLLGAL